jgi:phosphoadenosine phosphosulfate reductase
MVKNDIINLLETLEKTTLEDSLTQIANIFSEKAVFSTSFSEEDQIISHVIFNNELPIEVFTLDTGRLFPETYSTWAATLEKYQKRINAYYPNASLIEDFVNKNGPNAFYNTQELRKTCCHIRKVEPLKRAIYDKKIWITGIRAEHSTNRTGMKMWEWDDQNALFKFHPLLKWSIDEVKAFIKTNHIPVNPLHAKGFVSIGCAPCTRAIKPGEDFRAGRWWWEDESKKECGLHHQ